VSDLGTRGRQPDKPKRDGLGLSDVGNAVDATLFAARGRRWTQQYLPAIVVFVAAIALWELFVRALDIQAFLLPAPSVIADAFREHFDRLLHIGWFTTKEALGGFFIGSTLGILTALATARWSTASETLMPFAIAANSVPIIAFAPILNNWFGIDNPLSKMAIVAVIVFFPVMINTVRGLTLVDSSALELMRSYAAGEFAILFKLRFPNALPYMFNAFKVAAALSMIGAVVSEYFGGNRSALGVFITQEAAQFRFANAWAAIIVACIAGISFYLVIVAVERLVIPWHVSVREIER
jgi:NitT/TauT family transport system permease protein